MPTSDTDKHLRAAALAQQRVANAMNVRDTAVHAARNAGFTLREIASAMGISHEGVRRIINRG